MSNFFCECPDSGEPPCFGLVQLREQLAAALSELERVRDKCNEHYMALAAAQEAHQRAEALAERYKNPSAEAINASFHGMVETQDIPGQIARRAEFKRRYLLVIAAIDAAREGK